MNAGRLRALIRKESVQILRDPSALAIAFVLPLFLLLLFGYGVSLNAEHVPVGVVAEHPNPQTDSFVATLRQSRYFDIHVLTSLAEARAAMERHQISTFVWLRSDFARQMLADGPATIGVALNGVDANTARLVAGYLSQAWQIWLVHLQQARGSSVAFPIALQTRIWFNPALRSRDYLVPGLIAVIMTLIGALLTALVVAREWERGTMEALMASPATMAEILLGKLLPYFVLGMGGMALSVALAVFLFGVPLQGSLAVLTGISALFLLVALGMGLLISSLARNQFVAGQIAIVVTFLPAFILSGFIFDIRSMPLPVRLLTHILPARYFVSSLQTLFLAGNVWAVVLPDAAVLALMAVFFLGITLWRSHKRLD
ncbi:MAG TPA: ABC transporter permease [Rhodopila sp.]|nr:ABC transporter permease [Rhodopila sp.]